MIDLIKKRDETRALLLASVKALKTTIYERANAEREYRILVRQETLRLRSEGMTQGTVEMTVYGLDNVSVARMKRDIADETLKANYEAIQVYKLELRIMENDINRDYGMSGSQL